MNACSSKLLAAVLTVAGLSLPAPARADVTVTPSSNTLNTDNVVFDNAALLHSGPLVQGNFNGTGAGFVLNFTSASGNGQLNAVTSGQIGVEGLAGNTPFTQLSLALSQPNETFTKAVFNIDATATTGFVDFSIFEPNGQNSQIGGFFVGSGLNLFTIESIGGQSIRSISITAPSGIDVVNQIRIGGFARDGSSTSVPDTGSTIIMLGGVLAVIGCARLRRIL